jgi:hypothetical protein
MHGASAPMDARPIIFPTSYDQFVMDGVKNSLKEPDSAKFQAIRYFEKADGSQFACGLVNAKNSFGGYTGFQPFWASVVDLKSAGKGLYVVGVQMPHGKYADEVFRALFPRCAA